MLIINHVDNDAPMLPHPTSPKTTPFKLHQETTSPNLKATKPTIGSMGLVYIYLLIYYRKTYQKYQIPSMYGNFVQAFCLIIFIVNAGEYTLPPHQNPSMGN